jgi:hypothetical protein
VAVSDTPMTDCDVCGCWYHVDCYLAEAGLRKWQGSRRTKCGPCREEEEEQRKMDVDARMTAHQLATAVKPKIPAQVLPTGPAIRPHDELVEYGTFETNGNGNCSFHSGFGVDEDDDGKLIASNADDMRKSFENYLAHFEDLTKVPEVIRQHAIGTLMHWFDGGQFPLNMQDSEWVKEFKNRTSSAHDILLARLRSIRERIKERARELFFSETDAAELIQELVEVVLLSTASPKNKYYGDKLSLDQWSGDFVEWLKTYDEKKMNKLISDNMEPCLMGIAILLGEGLSEEMEAMTRALYSEEDKASMLRIDGLWKKFVEYVKECGSTYFLSMDDMAFVAQLSKQPIEVSCPRRASSEPTHSFRPLSGALTDTDGNTYIPPADLFPIMDGSIYVVHNGFAHFERRSDSATSVVQSQQAPSKKRKKKKVSRKGGRKKLR